MYSSGHNNNEKYKKHDQDTENFNHEPSVRSDRLKVFEQLRVSH